MTPQNPDLLGEFVSRHVGPDTDEQARMLAVIGQPSLEALATAYHDPRLLRFRLTDQEILAEAGIAHRPGHTYFDVSPYVIYDGGHGREGATASRGDGHSLARPAPGGHTGQTTVLDEFFAESGASPLGAAAVWDFPVTRSR